MPKFIVRAEYLSLEEFEVEADSQYEADEQFPNNIEGGDNGHNVGFILNRVVSGRPAEGG